MSLSACKKAIRNYVQKVQEFIIKLINGIKNLGCLSCLCITTVTCLIPLIVLAIIFKLGFPDTNFYTIYIDTQGKPLYIVDEKFLSLGLDSTVITDGFNHFNMTDPVLCKMIKHLSPAYLRIGGNQADQIVFSETTTPLTSITGASNASDIYILSAADWSDLYNLAREANINIIYDLNSLLRFENGTWNHENAEKMISFSQSNQFKLNWELGNEPNSYPHKFNTSVNATQLGIDYITLRDILNKTELYKNSYLVGPSTTRLRDKQIEEYFSDFLKSGVQAVSAITWHHYYFSGENATAEEFLDPAIFNYLEYHIQKVTNIVNTLNIKDKPIWLGETSSAWHSGAPNLSDKFIGSFIWIDKLGLSAKMGVNLIVRQSIFKGNYALLNNSYYPNPDWWLSVFYKSIVSTKVIDTNTEGDEKIRLYAHCAKNSSLWNEAESVVVVFGVNLSSKKGFVKIEELKSNENIFVFEFTAEDSLFSQNVKLNGKLLIMLPNHELPYFEPNIIQKPNVLVMVPYSIIFWVFPGSNAEACRPAVL